MVPQAPRVRTSPLAIREILPDEHAACATIYANAWNTALPSVKRVITAADFTRETEGERTLVGLLNNQIVGYVSIWEADWFIHHLYVDPLQQKSGVGRALLTHAEERAKPNPVDLKCKVANTGALAFYRLLGFEEEGEAGKDEYGDWLRLTKATI